MITAMPVRDSHAPGIRGHAPATSPFSNAIVSKEKLLCFKPPHFVLEKNRLIAVIKSER
ncbi:MAG TPA: hypothetical protein VGK96_03550 [Candidatus Sulfotelmatobacter sp.]|jgi:hypothetical protein